MNPEVAYAILQRQSLQLIHVLNGSAVPADAILQHLQQMWTVASELKKADDSKDDKAN
jgi:hypothetical protein